MERNTVKEYHKAIGYNSPINSADCDRTESYELTDEFLLRLVSNAGYSCPLTRKHIDKEGVCSPEDCDIVKTILDYLSDCSQPNLCSTTRGNMYSSLIKAYTECLNSSKEHPLACGTAQTIIKKVKTDIENTIYTKTKRYNPSIDPQELHHYTHGVMDLSEIEPTIPEPDPPEQNDLNLIDPDILNSMRLVYDEALKSRDEVITTQSAIIDKQNDRMQSMFEMIDDVLDRATQVPNQPVAQTGESTIISVPEQDGLIQYHG